MRKTAATTEWKVEMISLRKLHKPLAGLLSFALGAGSLHGTSVSAQYDVTFSVFGKIGEARVSYDDDGRFYHIHVDGGLTGTAASIGQHRREIHDSFGVIKDGVLEPTLYKKARYADHRDEETYYVFDHENKQIEKHRFRQKKVNDSRFDLDTMSFIQTPGIERSSSLDILPYYAENDLLSLFFNIRTLLCDIPEGKEKISHAAGVRNDKGEIVITNPAGKKRNELAALMPKNDNRFVTVVVDQDIFKSDRGELYMSLDEDFLAHEAMLKDVLLFGDIHGYRVWQRGGFK